MDEVKIFPNKNTIRLLLIGAIIFVVIGIGMLLWPGLDGGARFIGVLCLAFFVHVAFTLSGDCETHLQRLLSTITASWTTPLRLEQAACTGLKLQRRESIRIGVFDF